MGRKPSSIIAQYFQRGAKLSDSSNRYEHTCKYCATHFPKGRLESMKTHLFEECFMISTPDRQRALDHIGDDYQRRKGFRVKDVQVQKVADQVQVQGHDVDRSALETLAEVSQHHVEQEPVSQTRSNKKRRTTQHFEGSSSRLNDHLDNTVTPTAQQGVIDPQLGGNPAHHLRRSFVLGEPYKPKNSSASGPSSSSAKPSAPKSAPSAFLIDFRLEPAWGAQNVRSKFSASRKKEVGEIRKKGACVRCRMLKKPCSDGDPCDTCKIKGSRRLWKQPCVRTRLADELDVYDTRVFSAVVEREVKLYAIVPQPLHSTQQSFTASHFNGEHVPTVSVDTLTHKCDVAGIENDMVDVKDPSLFKVECINSSAEKTKATISAYVQQCTESLCHDASPIERSSIRRAVAMCDLQPDQLLDRVISLWTTIRLLTDTSLEWRPISSQSPPSSPHAAGTHVTGNDDVPSDHSIQIISAQLNLALSNHAQATAHALASGLEKRLLQRQSASSLRSETFLASVILLLCTAKLAWYYHTWTVSALQSTAQESHDGQPLTPREPWPLDDVLDCATKADHIASIVATLLRVRGIPPKLRVDNDGILRTEASETEGALDAASMWLDSLMMNAADLKTAMESVLTEESTYEGWEKRVLGELLLPEEE